MRNQHSTRLILPMVIVVVVSTFVATRPTPTQAAYLRIPVLMYHYVSTPPANADPTLLDLVVLPENFVQQMQYLKTNGFHTVTPDQVYVALTSHGNLPSNPVMLTFDDGYEDAYTHVFPTLKAL